MKNGAKRRSRSSLNWLDCCMRCYSSFYRDHAVESVICQAESSRDATQFGIHMNTMQLLLRVSALVALCGVARAADPADCEQLAKSSLRNASVTRAQLVIAGQ